MSSQEEILLLVGSPKGLEASSSARLGRRILDPLEAAGWQTNALHVHAAVRSDEGIAGLCQAVNAADVVVLSTPLYVDSLPAPVIHALEAIRVHRTSDETAHVPRFFTIVNCGFVDPWQNDTAQQMLEQFSSKARLRSVGSLSLGATGTVTKKVAKALEMIVEALQHDILVPSSVDELTRGRIVPAFLYILGGNMMWRSQAKKNGVRDQLKAQPYKRS